MVVLIAILFCLALQRFAKVGGWFQDSWFEFYLRYLGPWVAKLDARLIIVAAIVPVLLLFALVHFIFMWYWSGFFDLLLSVAVLLLCIDARDLKDRLSAYFKAMEESNMQDAASAAGVILDSGSGSTDLPRDVTKTILLQSFEKVFAGLFWFMIFGFGIYGLSIYFLVTLLNKNATKVNPNYTDLEKLAGQIQSIMEWLPVRLVGFTYALVGHFNKGFTYFIKNVWSGLKEIKGFAIESGLAALDVGSDAGDVGENEATLDLINRALIIWLVGMAVVKISILLNFPF